MKKSIFLFFAAILCAMSANAQWYLRGSFNGWGTSHQFVNNVCEIELPAGTSYEFKVADANWNTGYGYPAITSTSTKTQNGGNNTQFTTGLPGIYKFEISSDAKQLTVTYPEAPAPHDITVRAQVPASWTNTITAWVWTSEDGNGEEVTPTKDGDYYVVTKNAGALYVIFKNGAGWNGDNNQTVDLCYTEDVCLQLNQSGSAKATATVIDCGAVSKDITVKAVVPGAWENTITAWVWPTGGEGKKVTPTKDGNWYVVTENCIELNVIFRNGEDWSTNENQTANIEKVSENTCYQISAINKDGEGKCTYTVVDCEAAIEPEAKPVDVYTVVGSDVLLGTAWDLNNADNEMTKQDDGSYVLVKENVDLATTGTYEYKVVKNHDYGWSVPSGMANNTLKLGNEDVDGTYNITFTLNKELNALTASLELVEAKKVIPECYVAGDESLTGQDWNAKSVLMTYDEVTEVYTATLTAVPAGTHNMKVVYGGEWLGFDHLSTPAPANVKEGEDKKIQFTLAEAGDVTVTYHATNGINLTGNFAEPVTYDYYIVGSFNGDNPADEDHGMTLDGTVYKATVTLAAGDNTLKVTDGTWDNTWGATELGAAYEEVSNSNDGYNNIKITLAAEKEITVIFDATAGKITFEDLTPYVAPLTYTVTVPAGTEKCYIAGAFAQSNWNTFLEMEQVVGEDKFTITITGAKESDEYKYACQADWAYAEVIDGGGNRTNWSELDEVTAWGKPVIVTYQLKGVGGWEQPGIELVQNPVNDKEYMLTCQAISATDAIKVVRLEDGVIKDYYGNGTVKDGVEVTVNYDGAGNITLPEGKYNFYFDTNEPEKKLWIAAATDCEPTPDYTRTVGNNQFGTICLPFGGTITGAVLYQCVGRETGKVYLGSVTTLAAGVPYIFQATATELAVYSDGTTAAAGSSNGLHGTFDDETVVAAGNYILLGNALRPSNGEAKVNANRAYLVMSEVPAGKPQTTMPGRRYIGMDVQGENGATGVEDLFTTDAPVKVIENGQLIIIRDGVKYNVQGQKL